MDDEDDVKYGQETVTETWYDNDDSLYRPHEDKTVIEELEASYLGCHKDNFDPKQFDEHFNNCLLPKLAD